MFHWYTCAGRLLAKSAVRISRPNGFAAVNVLRLGDLGPT